MFGWGANAVSGSFRNGSRRGGCRWCRLSSLYTSFEYVGRMCGHRIHRVADDSGGLFTFMIESLNCQNDFPLKKYVLPSY